MAATEISNLTADNFNFKWLNLIDLPGNLSIC